MKNQRAYSILNIRSVSEEERVIEGIASTAAVDSYGDIIEPEGAEFDLPMPLLWQHEHDKPVGHVEFMKATKDGVPFKARIVKVDEPGRLQDRTNEAWQSLKLKLITGVSIGFRALEWEPMKGGGIRFKRWKCHELSLVTIPANSEATIDVVRSIDRKALAAAGQTKRSGVISLTLSGDAENSNLTKEKTMFDKQLKALEAKRAANQARMEAIAKASFEDGERSMGDDEREEYDTLSQENEDLDGDIVRLRKLVKADATTAKAVDGSNPQRAAQARSGSVIQLSDNLPKGTAFARYAMALAAGRGSVSDAIAHVRARPSWNDQTPQVEDFIRATAGNTTDEAWAASLVNETNLVSEFMEVLRPATILGALDGVVRVPFNVRIPVQTGGSTVQWVGEGAPKPVSDLAFSTVRLGMDKVAGIVVLTDELVRSSAPSAEGIVRNDLVRQIAQFLDAQLLDPTVEGTDDNPASLTFGVTPVAASGTDAEALYWDLSRALAAYTSTDLGLDTLTFVMPPAVAMGISLLRNALGQFEFGSVGVNGGTLMGYPVVVSNSAPAGTITLLKTSEILLADDGGVRLDASRDATLDMNGGNTPNFNLFQRNCIAIRAERFVSWAKRRADSVAVITGASYGPAAPVAP